MEGERGRTSSSSGDGELGRGKEGGGRRRFDIVRGGVILVQVVV